MGTGRIYKILPVPLFHGSGVDLSGVIFQKISEVKFGRNTKNPYLAVELFDIRKARNLKEFNHVRNRNTSQQQTSPNDWR